MLLKGKPAADIIKDQIIDSIKMLGYKGQILPKIVILRVGERPDDIAYEKRVIKNCETVGLLAEIKALAEDVGIEDFLEVLEKLNMDPNTHGILIFRPLPLNLDIKKISVAIKAEKDIDGMSPTNIAKVFAGDINAMAPCTAEAAVELLKHYYPNLAGKRAVIVNRSMVLGKPLSMLLLRENATVTICHSKTENLAGITSQADIVVTGVGRGRFFGPEYFSKDCIVVDAGINFVDGQLCGDVDFEMTEAKVQAITPVPGGLGAVTSMVLLRNVIKGMQLQGVK